MSLHNLAKELEKSGRGKDQMLVHMTPREVAGLQAIAKAHGGSLTVNPDTGLVEAGFLDNLLPSLLPTIAGVALASTGIGAPAAAMLIGGGTALATGSVEKGLMAGLGAYGGADIGGSLAQNATTQAATNAAQSGVIPGVTDAAGTQGLAGGVSSSANINPTALTDASTAATTQTPYGPTASPGTPQVSPSVTAAQTGTTATATGTPNPKAFTWDQLKSGYANTDVSKFVGDNYGKIGMAAAPTMAAAMEPKPYEEPEVEYAKGAYHLSPNFQGYTPAQPNPYYRPTGLGYAAGGILENMAPGGLAAIQGSRMGYEPELTPAGDEKFYGGGEVQRFANQGAVESKKKDPKAKLTSARNIAIMDPLEASMAELNNARYGANMSQTAMPKAGLAELGGLPYYSGGSIGAYSDGGRMLKGPGDGMSDSIPASIGNKQPARLADGEFVVPADVVSHLGNGSTDAGAKRLYAMMDKVRQARTGTKKQGKKINPDKYIPAFAEGGSVADAAPAAAEGKAAPDANLAGLAYLADLGRQISGRSVAAPAMTASDYGTLPTAQLAAAAANRPAGTPYTLDTPIQLAENVDTGGGLLSRLRAQSNRNRMSNARSYTDAQGNTWVRQSPGMFTDI